MSNDKHVVRVDILKMNNIERVYRASMRRRNFARGTIYKRMCELRSWLGHVGAEWVDATAADVEDWLDGRELGARSRSSAISHLHVFYEWAIAEDLAEVDPTLRIRRPRLPRSLPRPARLDAVDQSLEAAPADVALAMTLMVDAGLRCCEVARLEWSDVDLEAGRVFVTGKGGHHRVVGVSQRLRLRLYALDAGGGPVFGRKVSPARMSQIVNAHLRQTGVHCTAHQLRHTNATRMYRALDGDLLALQRHLGHASVTSTQIYAAIDPVVAVAAAQGL